MINWKINNGTFGYVNNVLIYFIINNRTNFVSLYYYDKIKGQPIEIDFYNSNISFDEDLIEYEKLKEKASNHLRNIRLDKIKNII